MTYIISFTKEELIKLKQVPAIGQQLKEIGPQADGGRMIDA